MKRLLSLLLAVVMIMSIAGCTQQPDKVESTSETKEVTETKKQEETAETKEQVTEKREGYKVAVSLGWLENESGQRQKLAFKEAFERYGITDYTIVDANYDPKKQSEQIAAIIGQKPDALFLTPSDPVGVIDATKKAAEAGIRVYSSDGFVPGAEVISTVLFDNYACGVYTMTYLANTLIEKYPGDEDIEIAMIDLPSNEGWDARGHGAKWVLSQPQYSRIKVTKNWSWDSTGAVTPRNAIDSFLAADPDKKLRAIWCAWDGAVFEGLEATAATRPEILYTGTDGGEFAFTKMAEYPDQFILTAGESIYQMPKQLVDYAMDIENGERVPRVVMVPGFAITSHMINDINAIRDYEVNGKTVWELVCNYDMPGNVDLINEALEANNKSTRWIPEI